MGEWKALHDDAASIEISSRREILEIQLQMLDDFEPEELPDEQFEKVKRLLEDQSYRELFAEMHRRTALIAHENEDDDGAEKGSEVSVDHYVQVFANVSATDTIEVVFPETFLTELLAAFPYRFYYLGDADKEPDWVFPDKVIAWYSDKANTSGDLRISGNLILFDDEADALAFRAKFWPET